MPRPSMPVVAPPAVAPAPRVPLHRRFAPVPRPARGLYPGEPETCRRDPRQFLGVMAHLGLLILVFRTYRIEGRAFNILTLLTALALPIHYALPYRFKKPALLAASLVGLAWIFGVATAAVVIPLAAFLIGLCYLPLPWPARAGLVAATAAALAVLRAGGLPDPTPAGTWPLLGSLLMFRMILFLYELKHSERPIPLLDAFGYFFLLPNYGFLHFPVVDFRTLGRSEFAAEIHAVQHEGLRMMVRGAGHLLLYRVVYHRLLIAPDEVNGPLALAGYLVCNYLKYLRVSGQFHVACGMMHLFGYRLPETHRNYLLATSFTDYWRRINIYWKDFMVRVVFHPVAFSLKRRPQPLALAAATLAVFVATWALHAYQAFWLAGSPSLSVPDALFWGVLGLLVLANVQVDARAPRRPAARGGAPDRRALAVRSLKALGTFAVIALLWSLWSSPSLASWLALLGRGLGAA